MKEITLRIFDDSDFGRLGAMMIEGDLWLVARDVAKAMGFGARRKGITDGVDGGLSVFENTEFGRVRTIVLDDKRMGGQNALPSIADSLGREQYPIVVNVLSWYGR